MALIQCKFCGRQFDTALGLKKCNLCGAALLWGDVPQDEEPRRPKWSSDYKAAHIPAREEAEPRKMNVCPECGNKMIPSEGCALCPVCGFGYCG